MGCDHDRRYSMSLPLESFLGDEGKVHFLSMIDPGPDFREDYREHIADKRLLLETFRRYNYPITKRHGSIGIRRKQMAILMELMKSGLICLARLRIW